MFLTRASVSYLWCNVSPLLVVTVSLLVLSPFLVVTVSYLWCNVSPLLVVTVSLLVLLSVFPSPGGNRVLTRASVSYLWCNVSPFLVVTVSLLVLLSLISGAMFPLSWW